MLNKGYDISRYPLEIARYFMANHSIDQRNIRNYVLLREAANRFHKDGLNSIKYKLVNALKQKLFTHIFVSYKL